MVRDVTIGQYYKTASFLHSMNPACKIAALIVIMVLIFIIKSPLEYFMLFCLCALGVALSKVPFSYILKGMKPVWVLLAFTALLNLFMAPGSDVLVKWGVFVITKESLLLALSMMSRVILLVVYSTLLTLTTSPMELTTGLEKILMPLERLKFPAHEVAMMMSIALRFIPTLSEEADKIIKAQAARGNDFTTGGIVKKAKGMIPLFVPLFIGAFRRADELALAMETRCYHGGKGRTSFRELRFTKKDAAALSVVFLFVIIIVINRTVGIMA